MVETIQLHLTPMWQHLLGTSCHTSPTENYSEIALPDSRITENQLWHFPGLFTSLLPFLLPFWDYFTASSHRVQDFTVDFLVPVRSCMQSQEQPQGCHSAGWEHHKATHTLTSSTTWSQNSTLRLFSPLQFSSQLFSFLFLPRSLCLCWRRSLRCHPAPLCSQHFTRSVVLNILRKVFCHFKQENIKKLIIFLGEEAKFWHPGELSWPSPPYFVSPSLVLCWIKYLEGEKEKTSPLVHP